MYGSPRLMKSPGTDWVLLHVVYCSLPQIIMDPSKSNFKRAAVLTGGNAYRAGGLATPTTPAASAWYALEITSS